MSQFENFGNFKAKLRKTAAVGAAIVALGGAGEAVGVKEALAQDSVKNKGYIASVENTKLNNPKVDEMEKRALICVERVRSELIQHFGSKAFLNKLTIEYRGNEEKAKAIQAEDVENLKTVKVDALLVLDIIKKAKGLDTNAKGEEAWAFYDGPNHKITIPKDLDMILKTNNILVKKNMEGYIREELIHSATKRSVSESATKILEDSYKKEGFLGLIKSNIDKYFSDPSERSARKQILDKELLEQLGKRYDEEFTEEHYKKMMDAYEAGKFSFDVDQFILRTLKDPKFFKKIMNEIAENESGNKVV